MLDKEKPSSQPAANADHLDCLKLGDVAADIGGGDVKGARERKAGNWITVAGVTTGKLFDDLLLKEA